MLALAFVMASYLLLEQPVAAAGAVASRSTESLNTFFHSFARKKGVYYVVSPEVIAARKYGPFDWKDSYIDVHERQIELGSGYVIVYGQGEKLVGRLELAKENMRVIGSRLRIPPGSHDPLQTVGETGIENLAEEANGFCGLQVFYGRRPVQIEVTSGDSISTKQLCIGFGIAAALGGYGIVPTRQGLELRQEFAVDQGAAIEGHTPSNPIAGDTSTA